MSPKPDEIAALRKRVKAQRTELRHLRKVLEAYRRGYFVGLRDGAKQDDIFDSPSMFATVRGVKTPLEDFL
jgi:hypothetical protein